MIRILCLLLLALACVPQVDAHGGAFFSFGRSRAPVFRERVFVQRQPVFRERVFVERAPVFRDRVFVERQFAPRVYGAGFDAGFVRPGFSAGFSTGGVYGGGGSAAFFSFRR